MLRKKRPEEDWRNVSAMSIGITVILVFAVSQMSLQFTQQVFRVEGILNI
jgi:hypothetical protein